MNNHARMVDLETMLGELTPFQRQNVPQSFEMNASLVRMFARRLSAKAKQDILKVLSDSTDNFEKPDTPGHDVWFPIHLATEMQARKLFSESEK